MAEENNLGMSAGASREFTTTHWSVVLAAGRSDSPQAAEALERLCRTYWYPLYAYVRRPGHPVQDAQNLTQAFFARLLQKKALVQTQREAGESRSFRLTALSGPITHHLAPGESVQVTRHGRLHGR
jgi:RNA polymerase sigma-70 factor (ECF subfamily)